MNCRRVISLMSAYVDGELTGADMLEIRRHLSECSECAEEHESILLTKVAVSRLRTAAPQVDLAKSIISRLDDVRVSPRQRAVNSLIGFIHGRLSPVAAALAVSGLALALLSTGGVQSIQSGNAQEVATASIQDVGFVRELSAGGVPLPEMRPLEVATPAVGLTQPSLQLISLGPSQ